MVSADTQERQKSGRGGTNNNNLRGEMRFDLNDTMADNNEDDKQMSHENSETMYERSESSISDSVSQILLDVDKFMDLMGVATT